jgi:hypothetical protein
MVLMGLMAQTPLCLAQLVLMVLMGQTRWFLAQLVLMGPPAPLARLRFQQTLATWQASVLTALLLFQVMRAPIRNGKTAASTQRDTRKAA